MSRAAPPTNAAIVINQNWNGACERTTTLKVLGTKVFWDARLVKPMTRRRMPKMKIGNGGFMVRPNDGANRRSLSGAVVDGTESQRLRPG